MYNEEDLKMEFDKCLPAYFKKNFEGKALSEAVDNTFKKEMFSLTQTYIKFCMLCASLITIKEQESGNLSFELGDFLDEYIECSDTICNSLNEILKPLLDRLNVTIS